MSPAPQTTPISFEFGLQEQYEPSLIPPGSASALKNWKPEATGGLRVRPGWNTSPRSGMLELTSKGRGIGIYQKDVLNERPVVVQSVAGTPWDNDAASYGGITWDQPTTPGNLLILGVEITQANASSAPTITVPAGWTLAVQQTSGYESKAAIYYKANAASNSGNVAVNFTKGSGASAHALGNAFLMEVSGIAPVGPLDQTATGGTLTDFDGTLSGTLSSVIGGVPKRLKTSVSSSATAQAAEFGVLVAGAHRSQSAATTSLLWWPSGIAYPDFFAIGGWVGVEERGYSKQSYSASGMANAGILARQIYLTRDTVEGDLILSNSDETMAPAIAMATFKAQSSEVTTVERRVLVANDNGSGHTIYAATGNNLLSSSFKVIGVIPNNGSGDPVSFATGLGVSVMTCARWASPYYWNGSGDIKDLLGAPAGRCVAFHKSRYFIGGSKENPTRLWFSDVGDYTSWPELNYIEVGQEDGEAIEDIAVFNNAILIGKQNSLWVLTGSGADSYVLTKLLSGGAAPGRSLCTTPYGALVAARDAVYFVTSESVETVSTAIEKTYGMSGFYMSTAYADGVAYVNDPGSGTTWCLNMKTGSWWTEEVADSGEAPSSLFFTDSTLIATPASSSSSGMVIWRLAPKGERVRDFDPLAEEFEAQTPEMWPVGPEYKFTPRHLYLKLRQRAGDASQTGIEVTPIYDGQERTPIYVQPITVTEPTSFRKRLDLGSDKSISSIRFKFSQRIPDGEQTLFDIEGVTLEYIVEAVR